MPTNEPITEEVLREVAKQLGHEAAQLATALGISSPRVQVIQRDASLRNSPTVVVNLEVLMMWVKALPKCADKVRVRPLARVLLAQPSPQSRSFLPTALSVNSTTAVYSYSILVTSSPTRPTSPNFLCLLPVAVAVARSFSGGDMMCYALPVLWMSSCFRIMDFMAACHYRSSVAHGLMSLLQRGIGCGLSCTRRRAPRLDESFVEGVCVCVGAECAIQRCVVVVT